MTMRKSIAATVALCVISIVFVPGFGCAVSRGPTQDSSARSSDPNRPDRAKREFSSSLARANCRVAGANSGTESIRSSWTL